MGFLPNDLVPKPPMYEGPTHQILSWCGLLCDPPQKKKKNSGCTILVAENHSSATRRWQLKKNKYTNAGIFNKKNNYTAAIQRVFLNLII